MGRWEPNARGRLQQAALELFAERGFEQATVTEIAKRAGLTERTFYRYFADKPEVFFAPADTLGEAVLAAIADAPRDASPIEAVSTAFESVTADFRDRGIARRRRAIIASDDGLQERELIKFARVAEAIAGALRERGVGDPAAILAGEAGVAVFRTAWSQWASDDADDSDASLAELVRASFDTLKAVASGK